MCMACVGLNWAALGKIKKDRGSTPLPQFISLLDLLGDGVFLVKCEIEIMFMLFVLV
jgi:hypothetical protein